MTPSHPGDTRNPHPRQQMDELTRMHLMALHVLRLPLPNNFPQLRQEPCVLPQRPHFFVANAMGYLVATRILPASASSS